MDNFALDQTKRAQKNFRFDDLAYHLKINVLICYLSLQLPYLPYELRRAMQANAGQWHWLFVQEVSQVIYIHFTLGRITQGSLHRQLGCMFVNDNS